MSRALTPQQRQKTIRDLLEKAKPKLAEVLPRHLTPDRLIRIACAATSRNRQLLACTPQSLLLAVMNAAQLGLEAGSPLGSAYLVPYGDTCQLIVGYRGLIELARRSGEISMIEAHIVHENDAFTCRFGMEPVLEHEPCWTGDSGDVLAAYAVAKLTDGSTQVEVMTRTQIDAIKNRSRAGRSGPWVTDYEEMARKTVVRRLCKYLPLSVEMSNALDMDVSAEVGTTTADVIDIDIPDEALPPEPATRNDEVREALIERMSPSNGHAVEPEPEPEPEIDMTDPAIKVAHSHGKTAKKIIENTWDIKLLNQMGQQEEANKRRQKVLELIHLQIDLAQQEPKEVEGEEVEVEVVEAKVEEAVEYDYTHPLDRDRQEEL